MTMRNCFLPLTSLLLISLLAGCAGNGEVVESAEVVQAGYPAAALPGGATENAGLLVWVAEVEGEWDLYLRETPDGGTLRLTTDPAWDWGPALSPDGRRLAWLSTRDGQEDVYLAELTPDGLTGIERLTDNFRREGFLTWGTGADGALYYSALDYDGTGKLEFYDIYRLNPGGGAERLTDRPGMFYAPVALGDRLYAVWQPEYGIPDYRLVELAEGGPVEVLVDGEPVSVHCYAENSPAQPRALSKGRLLLVRDINGETRLTILDPDIGVVSVEARIDPTAVLHPTPADDAGLRVYHATAADPNAELALRSVTEPCDSAPLTDNGHFDGYPCWAPLLEGD